MSKNDKNSLKKFTLHFATGLVEISVWVFNILGMIIDPFFFFLIKYNATSSLPKVYD